MPDIYVIWIMNFVNSYKSIWKFYPDFNYLAFVCYVTVVLLVG